MNKLKELRLKDKKDVKEVSKILNITEQAYYKYEIGKNEPNIEKLCKLADYYNVSLDYLVGRNFSNELGYLSKEQYETVKAYLSLTRDNQLIITGRVLALLESQ